MATEAVAGIVVSELRCWDEWLWFIGRGATNERFGTDSETMNAVASGREVSLVRRSDSGKLVPAAEAGCVLRHMVGWFQGWSSSADSVLAEVVGTRCRVTRM